MIVDILTTFPEMVRQAVSHSIIGRAIKAGKISVRDVNLRDFAYDRHRTTDDSPYGGSVGMVMKIEPIKHALDHLETQAGKRPYVILTGAGGETFSQKLASELSQKSHLAIICGHYEGVDERVRENLVDREISVGDYVLTGGELPSLVIVDAVARLLPGVLGKDESSQDESYTGGLLEYPHYTRPEDFNGWKVPDVLLSGHHAEIAAWRRKEALRRTLQRRPDLLAMADLSQNDLRILEQLGAGVELLEELRRK